MIKLQNKLRIAQTFNLPHTEPHLQTIEMRHHVELPDGIAGVREVTKRLPGSFTILGGAASEPLPDDVAEAREVKAALDRGTLRLVQLGATQI